MTRTFILSWNRSSERLPSATLRLVMENDGIETFGEVHLDFSSDVLCRKRRRQVVI